MKLVSRKEDFEQIQQLSRIANVVPLISKSDLLSSDQIEEVRSAVPSESSCMPCLPMVFDSRLSLASSSSQAGAPYAVSCVHGPDFDNMDASLLMSSEYIQPLRPSELHLLVDQIFQPDNITYLRHTAAKKLIAWYNSGSHISDSQSLRTSSPVSTRMKSPLPSDLNSPLQASLSASGVLVPMTSHSELSLNTSNSFALAKVADHTHKEERLAQIRLSRWASDLQLSLQRERERYESIARSERAVWLVERMGEEIRDGQLISVSDDEDTHVAFVRKGRKTLKYRNGMTYQVHDPLDLLKWQEKLAAQTWLALQVVGGFGVAGGLALWIMKTWGYETEVHRWPKEWGIWHE